MFGNRGSILFVAPVVTSLVGFASHSVAGAQRRPWPSAVAAKAFKEKGQAGYLAAVLDLIERENEAMASDRLRDHYRDVLATRLAFVGEHSRATQLGDEAYGMRGVHPDMPKGDPLAEYSPVPAVDAIVKAAGDRRLVMVNEEHRSSEQRAFTNRLLAPLRKLGFRHLAIETVHEDPAALNARGYPVLTTGFYSRDPAFGDLIRRALQLGYTIVSYEGSAEETRRRPEDRSPGDAMNRRERIQARNIHERTFAGDPRARVLVVAGRDHIAERAGDVWTPMGGVLKELSGIDPLTIDLYEMVEHSDAKYEHWAFKAASDRGWTRDGPVLLVDKQGAFWSAKPGVIDAYVLHPRTAYVGGRPQWMEMGGLRKRLTVAVPEFEEPMLLQAHLTDESDNAVPVDQVVLWPGKPTPSLLLRPGAYTLRVIDREGKERFRAKRTVD